jgi:hypothetical protein
MCFSSLNKVNSPISTENLPIATTLFPPASTGGATPREFRPIYGGGGFRGWNSIDFLYLPGGPEFGEVQSYHIDRPT